MEGDIGMRYSLRGVAEAVGADRIAADAGLTGERTEELLSYLETHKETVPDSEEFIRLDEALAGTAVETACMRHAGQRQTPFPAAEEGRDMGGQKIYLSRYGVTQQKISGNRALRRRLLQL